MNTISALIYTLNALRTIASGDSERMRKYVSKNMDMGDYGVSALSVDRLCEVIAQDALDKLEGRS